MGVEQRFLGVLQTVASTLEAMPITWAVTGSCSLALQGIPVAVHDIDLRTDDSGAYAIERCFAHYSVRHVVFSSTGTVRSHFGALEINGIQVEIIGDMQHLLNDGTWEPLVDMNNFKKWIDVAGITIPVMSLEFLYQAYQLLGRSEQVAVLREYLQPIDSAQRSEAA